MQLWLESLSVMKIRNGLQLHRTQSHSCLYGVFTFCWRDRLYSVPVFSLFDWTALQPMLRLCSGFRMEKREREREREERERVERLRWSKRRASWMGQIILWMGWMILWMSFLLVGDLLIWVLFLGWGLLGLILLGFRSGFGPRGVEFFNLAFSTVSSFL